MGTLRYMSHRLMSSAGKKPLDQHQKELMSRGLPKRRSIPGVGHVILVASGKGGVGKSTTAVNLALSLSRAPHGLRVGILDADVYGPSVPVMMNVNERPLVDETSNKMIPLTNYGLKCMSMGFLVADATAAVVWRGPMVMGALEKMAHGTEWAPLDVLVVDTPPGTGDVQLSLAQTVEIRGAVMVTTPQKVAVSDTRRGATMFEKVGIPLLGVVENMSGVACPDCGRVSDVFGSKLGLVDAMARELDVKVLGRVPLEEDLSAASDGGTPIVLSNPGSKSALCYSDIARQILRRIEKEGQG